MNVDLHLRGDEVQMTETLRLFRTTGIAFGSVAGSSFTGSAQLIRRWDTSNWLTPLVIGECFIVVRERDAELAIMTSRVSVKVLTRKELILRVGSIMSAHD